MSLLKDRVVGLRLGTGKVGTEKRMREESAGWTSLMDCVWLVVERTEATNYLANSGWLLEETNRAMLPRENMGLPSDYEATKKQAGGAHEAKLAGNKPGGGGQTKHGGVGPRRGGKKKKNSNTPNS